MVLPQSADLLRFADTTDLPERLSSIDENALGEILDRRDASEHFEVQWRRAFEKFTAANVTDQTSQTIRDACRRLFLRISSATSGHEIAAYVADDLELIGLAAAVASEDTFVQDLWSSYLSGKVPEPTESD